MQMALIGQPSTEQSIELNSEIDDCETGYALNNSRADWRT